MDKLKKLNRVVDRKAIRSIIVPIILFSFWPLFSFLFVPRQSLTTVNENYSLDKTSTFKEGRLLKGEKVSGKFFASYDKLGALSIHAGLRSDNLDNTDQIIFRIKEDGSLNWYYENEYDAGFFNRMEYSPFGFPLIENSKGKIYYFELESKYGNEDNSLIVYAKKSAFIATYKYSPKEMLLDPKLSSIMQKNAYKEFTDKNFISYSSIFILPFIFYVIFYVTYGLSKFFSRIISKSAFLSSVYKKYVIVEHEKNLAGKKFSFLALLILLFYDVFFISAEIHGLFLMLFILWVFYLVKYKLGSEIILITLILFLISSVLIALNLQSQLQKVSIWIFGFLCLSLIRCFLIIKTKYV